MRNFIILLSLVGVFILGYWVKNLRQENTHLESRVERMETRAGRLAQSNQNTAQLRTQLNTERQRLDQLRDSLNEAIRLGVQPPTGSVDAHISNLTRRISTLEQNLTALNRDTRVVTDNARIYQQQMSAQTIDQQLELQTRIQDINTQIATLQNLGAAQQEIEALVLDRNQLQNQIQMLNTAAAGQNLAASQAAEVERTDIQLERQTLELQLQDLRADLQYWRNMRSDRAPATTQPTRVRELQELIRHQESRLNELDQRIESL